MPEQGENTAKRGWKNWTKQKQVAIGFILLGILFGVYIFIFLSYNVLAVKGIPELLPEEETAFFMQFDLKNPMPTGRQAQIEQTQQAKIENILESWAKENFAISLKKNLLPYSTGLIGIAYFSPIVNGNSLVPVLILEQNSQNPLSDDFVKKNEKTLEIALINNFYVINKPQESQIALSQESLAGSYLFLKTIEDVPPDAFSYFYFQPQKIKNLLSNFYYDFGRFQTIGGFLTAGENGVLVSAKALASDYSEIKDFYSGNLLSLLPENPELLIGGQTKSNNELSILVENWLSDTGINDIDVGKILTTIANKEYGLAFYKNNLLFISEWKNDKKFTEEYQNLEKNMPRILSILLPDINEVTLADGSKGKELIANESSIEKTEEEINGGKILIFKKPRETMEFAIAVIDNHLFFATDVELIKKALSPDLKSFKKSDSYQNTVSETMRGIDEIVFSSKKIKFPLFKEICASTRAEDESARIFVFLED